MSPSNRLYRPRASTVLCQRYRSSGRVAQWVRVRPSPSLYRGINFQKRSACVVPMLALTVLCCLLPQGSNSRKCNMLRPPRGWTHAPRHFHLILAFVFPPSVSISYFGTSPEPWNYLLKGMTWLPQSIMGNRDMMQALAEFSEPLVRITDKLVRACYDGYCCLFVPARFDVSDVLSSKERTEQTVLRREQFKEHENYGTIAVTPWLLLTSNMRRLKKIQTSIWRCICP